MEKLLTTDKEVFKGFLDGAKSPAASEVDVKQAYHYIAVRFLLDCLAPGLIRDVDGSDGIEESAGCA